MGALGPAPNGLCLVGDGPVAKGLFVAIGSSYEPIEEKMSA